MNLSLLKKKSIEMRKKIFSKYYLLKEGHPGSVFSIMDILIVPLQSVDFRLVTVLITQSFKYSLNDLG